MDSEHEEVMNFIEGNIDDLGLSMDQVIYTPFGKYKAFIINGTIALSKVYGSDDQATPSNRDMKDLAEWDFIQFVGNPDKKGKRLVDSIEGDAAIEYELSRELFFNDRFRGPVLEQVAEEIDFFERYTSRINRPEMERTPISDYLSIHPYITDECFPIVPWFRLDKNLRRFYTALHTQAKSKLVPRNTAVTIDLTWSDNETITFLKECRRIVEECVFLTSSQTTEEEKTKGVKFETSQGGRKKDQFHHDLFALGRYRVLRKEKSVKMAREFWDLIKGSSPSPDDKNFNKKNLLNWYRGRMGKYIDSHQFLSSFPEVKKIMKLKG